MDLYLLFLARRFLAVVSGMSCAINNESEVHLGHADECIISATIRNRASLSVTLKRTICCNLPFKESHLTSI